MLKQIDQFQKEASTFKLDPNSVVAFETWAEFKNAAKIAGRKNDSAKEFNLFIEAKKVSDAAEKFIGDKVEHLMKEEGKTQDQALGQAYGMAREKGYDVPAPPKSSSKKVAEPEEKEDMGVPSEEGLLSPDEVSLEDEGDEESHEEGEESPEEEAKELMAQWGAGEMSLKEVFQHLDEEFEEDQEEKTEAILADMIDKKFKELTGEEGEDKEKGEEGKEEKGD